MAGGHEEVKRPKPKQAKVKRGKDQNKKSKPPQDNKQKSKISDEKTADDASKVDGNQLKKDWLL